MAVDFSILERTPTIASRYMQGEEAAQQQAERNMLRRMQMQQMAVQQENMLAQREQRMVEAEQRRATTAAAADRRARLAAVSQKLGGPLTLDAVNKTLAEAVQLDNPEVLRTVMQLRNDLMAEAETERAFGPRGGALAPAPVSAPAGAPTEGAMPSIAPAAAPATAPEMAAVPGPANALAAPPSTVAAPAPAMRPIQFGGLTYTPEQLDAMRRSRAPQYRELYGKIAAAEAQREMKELELKKPTYQARTRGDVAEVLAIRDGTATVVPGSQAAIGLTEAQRLQDERAREQLRNDQRRLQLEAQRVGLDQRRTVVAEQNARQAADPAFQQRMAQAKAAGEAIAKSEAAAQQLLPRVISRAEDGLRLIDELVGKQEVRDRSGKVVQPSTKPHPGFETAVGATWLPGSRFVPGTSAADFQTRFDQIKGASFLEAFESLKGGGAITEKEGAKGTDAINRMSLAQSESEFVTAARDLQDVIRKGVANAQRRAAGAGAGATGEWSVVR